MRIKEFFKKIYPTIPKLLNGSIKSDLEVIEVKCVFM